MATFNSDKIVSGSLKVLPLGYVQGILATAAVPSTLAAADVINLVALEANPSITANGPTILNIVLGSDDLDSGGSPTITLNVGDTGSATRFFSAATTAQAGGRLVSTTTASLGYQPFAASFNTYTTASFLTYTIFATVQAAAATAAAGNIRLLVEFTVDP